MLLWTAGGVGAAQVEQAARRAAERRLGEAVGARTALQDRLAAEAAANAQQAAVLAAAQVLQGTGGHTDSSIFSFRLAWSISRKFFLGTSPWPCNAHRRNTVQSIRTLAFQLVCLCIQAKHSAAAAFRYRNATGGSYAGQMH